MMFKPGDILYFHPEELTILVVIASNEGVRYIEPMNPQFNDNGNIITRYADNKTLLEWTSLIGSMDEIIRKVDR